MLRTVFTVSAALFCNVAVAGPGYVASPMSVPVDSPLALIGLAAAAGLIGARLLKQRTK